MKVQAGTYEFGVWDEASQNGFWQGGFVVDQSKVKDIVLLPQMMVDAVDQMYFLGGFTDGDTVTARLYAAMDGTPVTGLTSGVFDIWVHNWEQDQSNWWDNPVENQYHAHLEAGEVTVNELGDGIYTVSFTLSTAANWHTYGVFQNGGHFNLDVRVGNAGMGFDFEVLTGEVYTVSGTVTDVSGDPVEGVFVDMWSQAGGAHAETDAQGQYSMKVRAGTWEFGVWDEVTMKGYYEAGLVVNQDLTKDVTIFPELDVHTVGDDPFLGFVQNGDTLVGDFEILEDQTPYTGFDTSILTVWVHSVNDPTMQDQDPANDWSETRIPNQYHADITSEVTLSEIGNGVYRVQYTVDTTNPVLALGGGFGLEVEFAGHGVHWPFGVFSGQVYTISGTVTDQQGNPVDGGEVGVWNQEFWFGDKTDNLGEYSITCPAGTYEFGVEPAPKSGYDIYYEPSVVIDQDITNYDIILE